MTDFVHHATIVIGRTFAADPARVFGAFTDADAKARWFVGPDDWKVDIREIDARPGGRERLGGTYGDGTSTLFLATYHDVVRQLAASLSVEAAGRR